MTIQTTYLFTRAAGYPGALADGGPHRVRTVLAAVAIAAGLVVLRDQGRGNLPGVPDAAAVDAILATGGASAGAAQNISGVALNGPLAGDDLVPGRNLTITLSNNAHWIASVITVTGVDEDGEVIQEDFRVPAGGNVTLTGAKHFSRVTAIHVPAQGGAAGTFTVGIGTSLGPITGRTAHGIAVYDASRQPGPWAANTAMPVCDKGPIYATTETAYGDGDPVFVRCIAGVGETAGHLRASPDGGDCVLLKGARFRGSGVAGPAVIDLNL